MWPLLYLFVLDVFSVLTLDLRCVHSKRPVCCSISVHWMYFVFLCSAWSCTNKQNLESNTLVTKLPVLQVVLVVRWRQSLSCVVRLAQCVRRFISVFLSETLGPICVQHVSLFRSLPSPRP